MSKDIMDDEEAKTALIYLRDCGYSVDDVVRTFELIERWYETGMKPREL